MPRVGVAAAPMPTSSVTELPVAGSPREVLALQRLVGNRAVEQLLSDRSPAPTHGVAPALVRRPVAFCSAGPVIRRKLSDADKLRLGAAYPDLPSIVASVAEKVTKFTDAQLALQYATGGSPSGPVWNALKPQINDLGPTLAAMNAASAQGIGHATIDRCWTDLIRYPLGNRNLIANEIRAVLAKKQIGEPGLLHLLESFQKTALTGLPDLQGRVAQAPRIDFFNRFKIGDRLGTLGYESVIDKVAVIPPVSPDPVAKADSTGYVVNVATIPSDPSPRAIAEKYGEQGFADKSQAAKRLGIVVGVNRFKSLNGASEDAVRAHANDVGMPDFNVRSFGFTWQLNWESLNPSADADGYAGAKAAYDQQDEPTKQRILAYEKANLDQKHIPYGLIKERVTASPLTKELVTELTKHNKRVYIHLGDADAVSLRAPEEQQSVGGELKDKGTKLTALFDRYDKIVEEQGTPMMAIGGYEFRLRGLSEETADKPQKGDLKRTVVGDNLTYLANQLDEAVRIAIASIKPEAVYPTEPNLIFLAADPSFDLYGLDVFNPDGTITTEGALMGTGAREGRKLEKNLIKAREKAGFKAPANKVAYDPRASIATGSKRFRLGPESRKQQGKGKEYKEDRERAFRGGIRGTADTKAFAKGKEAFKAQVIEDIVQQTQSFVDPRAFSREVGEAIPLKIRGNLEKFSHRVSNHIYKKLLANKEKYTAKAVFKAPGGAKPPTREEKKEQEVERIIAAIEAKLTSPDLDWLWTDLGKAIDDLYIAAGHT